MEHGARETLRIQIVLASDRTDDRQTLEDSLAGTPWRLVVAANFPHAIQCLHGVAVPIVLCDSLFDLQPWRIMLRVLRRERRRTCVILMADEGNAALASEVVQRGGFDLLTRPFRREEVFPTLVSAYARCRVYSPLARTPRRDAVRVAEYL
jgi:DNA-binding NtrC family response regulator